MGCCSSSLVDQDYTSSTATSQNNDSQTSTSVGVGLPGVYYNKSRPFKRTGLMWTSETPISILELEQKRYLYWETAPSYSGRLEIWQALQVAFSEPDIIMARSILEAANVILPTGNPCEGCFDELGNEYSIPIYCVVTPTNLNLSEDDDATFDYACTTVSLPVDKTDSTQSSNHFSIYSTEPVTIVPAPDSSSHPFPITVRLSTDVDLKLDISTEQETIGSLRTRIFDNEKSGIHRDAHVLRLIYLGRILKDNVSIICEHLEEIDSEQTFMKKGSVRIVKDCIIQALVTTKKQP